ncbi:MAG: hypothetical protein JW715_15105 [Sedimentisphaerales bacterium]|nr:hypothetical protein [Sedimentisphaerales bacterium]
MSHYIIKLCEYLEKLGKISCDIATYLLLLILNPGHRYIEVKKEIMIPLSNYKSETSTKSEPKFNINAAREYYEREVIRGKIIDEKNKVLLTVTSLLVAANAIIASNIEPKWLVLLPLIPTMISIFLILVHFGVQSISVPEYEIENESKLAESFYKCKKSLSLANDFRVGVYRASLRAVTLGVLLLMITFIYFAFHGGINTKEEVIKSEKNNIEQQVLLGEPQETTIPKVKSGAEKLKGL